LISIPYGGEGVWPPPEQMRAAYMVLLAMETAKACGDLWACFWTDEALARSNVEACETRV
jgi:hypothetical protein